MRSWPPRGVPVRRIRGAQKGWKRCACFIFASGTLAGKFKRKYTGKSDWDKARAAAAEWEKAGAWDAQGPPPPNLSSLLPSTSEREPEMRVTLERAIRAFIAEFEEHAAVNTQKKYRLLLIKLKAFAESKGYIMLDQWTPVDVREFRSSWSVSPQTAAKNMSTVKAFFEFCLSNEWILRNPARMVRNQRGRDAADRRREQKLSFSDEEIRRMYGACETRYGKQEIKWSRVIHHQRVEGQYASVSRVSTLATTPNGPGRTLQILFLFRSTQGFVFLMCAYST